MRFDFISSGSKIKLNQKQNEAMILRGFYTAIYYIVITSIPLTRRTV